VAAYAAWYESTHGHPPPGLTIPPPPVPPTL
jgi:sulfate permease, SulP family